MILKPSKIEISIFANYFQTHFFEEIASNKFAKQTGAKLSPAHTTKS